jgi:hypothetical protein
VAAEGACGQSEEAAVSILELPKGFNQTPGHVSGRFQAPLSFTTKQQGRTFPTDLRPSCSVKTRREIGTIPWNNNRLDRAKQPRGHLSDKQHANLRERLSQLTHYEGKNLKQKTYAFLAYVFLHVPLPQGGTSRAELRVGKTIG